MKLFTWAWLATVAGATLATVLVTNGLAAVFGWSARWVALAVALGALPNGDTDLARLCGWQMTLTGRE